MATPKSQRIGIWIIAIVMMIGSIGVYFIAILANNNDQDLAQKQQEEYQKMVEQQQKQDALCPRVVSDDKKISPAPTPPELSPVDDIAELRTEDVTIGEGAEVKEGDCIELLFHGVLASNGEAFQGGDNYATGLPYRSVTTGFVPGFAQGLVGMKVGGERKIFIPSSLGYGSQASESIPADSDLIFVVRVTDVHTPAQ